jgi:hypothetical protein
MPTQTQEAVNWALTQKDENGNAIAKNTPQTLVDKVREYFNTNNIPYPTFSYDDLLPFLD